MDIIMDYEKEYKEALEKARDVYTYYCDDREQLRKIEFIFPKLKESEDERIRKELIDAVQDLWDNDALPMPLSVNIRAKMDCDLCGKARMDIKITTIED